MARRATFEDAARALDLFDQRISSEIVIGLNKAGDYAVGVITRSPVMQRLSTERDRFGQYIQPANRPPGPLGIRTGALARSVSPIPARQVSPNSWALGFDVGVVYGRIHELGGVIHHPGSSKRQVFHAKGASGTGGVVWTQRTAPHDIRIPARPYIRPGVERALPVMTSIVEVRLAQLAQDVVG